MNTSQFIPHGGFSVPILGQYLLGSIFYIALSSLAAIKLTNIQNTGNPLTTASSWHCNFVFTRLTPIFGPRSSFYYFIRKSGISASAMESSKDAATSEEPNGDTKGPKKHFETIISASEKLEIVCETLNRVSLMLSFCILTIFTAVMVIALLV